MYVHDQVIRASQLRTIEGIWNERSYYSEITNNESL